MEKNREEDMRAKDTISSLEEPKSKATCMDLPAMLIGKEIHIMFLSVRYLHKPEISYCLYLNESLDYKLWSRGNEVKNKSVKLDEMSTIPPLLNSIQLVEKLLCI